MYVYTYLYVGSFSSHLSPFFFLLALKKISVCVCVCTSSSPPCQWSLLVLLSAFALQGCLSCALRLSPFSCCSSWRFLRAPRSPSSTSALSTATVRGRSRLSPTGALPMSHS
ncbi:uncharacterized protein Tco025E_00042 [Trypanosoma conorhini]|uniref:Uncharacterized protein n=1 Tax=Trypanosoma conorhini TaxID=83891 RepID=A0A3R7LMN2_9TRYP|nr:uncharacterized protein Tco025E_00042 [Trypanosoma conorhini]RNF27658.1 hypothetical protein Tco025E_00042 [Trypanosoma conorhini]